MSNLIAESIKDMLDVKEVLIYYGVEFNRKGFALCPFHTEKTASLSINGKYYRCFGCGVSGGVIDFVMEYFGLSFGQAIVKLNSDFALGLSVSKPTYRDQIRARQLHQKRQHDKEQAQVKHDIYLAFTDIYRELYRTGWPGAKEYLERLDDWLDEKMEEGWASK